MVPNTELRIADDQRAAVPDGQVGHILIRGPSVTRGYFGDPEATALAISADGWLDTGDVGVMHEGSLYITGRSKEIIFVNGQNYYPYDLENIAQRAPGLDLNKVVAAGVAKPGTQGEELVVFVLHRGSLEEFLPTAAAVTRLINEHTGLEVAQVIPVKRIPKTTSGKVQRHLLEQAYIEGEFDAELCRTRGAARGAPRAPRDRLRPRGAAADDLRGRAAGQAHRGQRQSVRDRRKLSEAHRDPREHRSRFPGTHRSDRAVRSPDDRGPGEAPAGQN